MENIPTSVHSAIVGVFTNNNLCYAYLPNHRILRLRKKTPNRNFKDPVYGGVFVGENTNKGVLNYLKKGFQPEALFLWGISMFQIIKIMNQL
jgi:hypothetical protein